MTKCFICGQPGVYFANDGKDLHTMLCDDFKCIDVARAIFGVNVVPDPKDTAWVIVDCETGTVLSTKNLRVIGASLIENALNDGNEQLVIDIATDLGFTVEVAAQMRVFKEERN